MLLLPGCGRKNRMNVPKRNQTSSRQRVARNHSLRKLVGGLVIALMPSPTNPATFGHADKVMVVPFRVQLSPVWVAILSVSVGCPTRSLRHGLHLRFHEDGSGRNPVLNLHHVDVLQHDPVVGVEWIWASRNTCDGCSNPLFLSNIYIEG